MTGEGGTAPPALRRIGLALEPGPFAGREEAGADEFRTARGGEFLAGRRCAARALRRVGCEEPRAIPKHESGRPSWPTGYIGSIAHAPGCCVAVAASARDWAGIGVDCEIHRPLAPEARSVALISEDERQIERLVGGRTLPFHWCTIFFCIKEAAFKALSALDRDLFEFEDVQVRLASPQSRRFTIRSKTSPSNRVHGRFQVGGRHIIAVALANASASANGDTALPLGGGVG